MADDRYHRQTAWEKLSIPELEALLQAEFFSSSAGKEDVSKVIEITKIIQEKEAKESECATTDVDAAWQRFQQRNLTSAKAELEPIPLRPAKRRKPMRRMVMAGIAAAILFSLFVIPVNGVNLFAVLAGWSNETFSFSVDGTRKPEAPDNAMLESLRESVAMYTDLSVVPHWCPTDFKEFRLICEEFDPNSDYIHATFTRGGDEDQLVHIAVQVYDEGKPMQPSTVYEKDDTPVIEYRAGGVVHYIMSNLGTHHAIWITGNLECSISGRVSVEELKQMIDSIYEE